MKQCNVIFKLTSAFISLVFMSWLKYTLMVNLYNFLKNKSNQGDKYA